MLVAFHQVQLAHQVEVPLEVQGVFGPGYFELVPYHLVQHQAQVQISYHVVLGLQLLQQAFAFDVVLLVPQEVQVLDLQDLLACLEEVVA